MCRFLVAFFKKQKLEPNFTVQAVVTANSEKLIEIY